MRRSRTLIACAFGAMMVCGSPYVEAEMMKQVVIIDSASGDTTIGDRFYFNVHAPETVRHYGPWLARYWSYRMFNVPAEADRYNPNRGRLTEIWYRVEDLEEMNAVPPAYSQGEAQPGWSFGATRKGHATVFVPAVPTDRLVPPSGREPVLDDRRYLRWMIAVDYPQGVDLEVGERWFREVLAERIKEIPGVLRFVSWRAHEAMIASPRCTHKRLVEIWFADYDAWRAAFVDDPPEMPPPPWAAKAGPFESFLDIVSGFVGVWPDVDFLHDTPRSP